MSTSNPVEYEMDDVDRDLLSRCAKAVSGLEAGIPVKDYLEHDDIEDALKLLMRVTGTKVPDYYDHPDFK